MIKKECTLEAEVLVDLDHGLEPFGIFQTVTGMNELLEIILTETNRYATQNGRNFEKTEDGLKTFLGINFIMGIIKLPLRHKSFKSCITIVIHCDSFTVSMH